MELFTIAGVQFSEFFKDRRVLAPLKIGEKVSLFFEKDNEYDPNAIVATVERSFDGEVFDIPIGYIAKADQSRITVDNKRFDVTIQSGIEHHTSGKHLPYITIGVQALAQDVYAYEDSELGGLEYEQPQPEISATEAVKQAMARYGFDAKFSCRFPNPTTVEIVVSKRLLEQDENAYKKAEKIARHIRNNGFDAHVVLPK